MMNEASIATPVGLPVPSHELALDAVRRDGGALVFALSVPADAAVKVGVHDVTGRRVWSERFDARSGRQEFRRPVRLQSGIYFAVASDGLRHVTRKFAWLR